MPQVVKEVQSMIKQSMSSADRIVLSLIEIELCCGNPFCVVMLPGYIRVLEEKDVDQINSARFIDACGVGVDCHLECTALGPE